LTHYRDIQRFDQFDIGKIDFNPSGNEVLSGSLCLKVFDVTSGDVIKEFNKGSKAITSLSYVTLFY
jgi:WD40 repeat protein